MSGDTRKYKTRIDSIIKKLELAPVRDKNEEKPFQLVLLYTSCIVRTNDLIDIKHCQKNGELDEDLTLDYDQLEEAYPSI